MKKSIIKSIITILIIGIFSSCTEVVNVEVPNGGARLVVEASILWEKGTTGANQTIKLSTSTEYFSDTPNVPVTNATVQVTNTNTGEVFTFLNQNNGEYTTNNFNPILNNEYQLEVVNDGKTYTAVESLVSVSEIKNIEQESVSSIGGDDEIRLKIYFDDPANEANFYLGAFKASNLAIPDLETLDDEFTDGNENFIEYEDEDLTAGATITISLQGISQRYYNYIDLLVEQLGQGGPFQTTPARLKGNCINVNDSNEEVFGYFRLSETVNDVYTIN
ncbi:hypothetical protein WH52_10365 [Tenacibaculum holothuriorum]|uniref:DUF4249 domain-containing protein n=1 Tax=Tenacibaculum holothuriorum TaxID=1635173 RepID=A0A1Y2PDR0_9FLAO|nr:DUF4249 family protein [Tenacibaculum holothuriorum]OSY87818.1 hypothetical protein WH52_10365 [Tenacibaculum holothuriorum]